MKFITYYIKRLKMKYYYSPKNMDSETVNPKIKESVETLKSHYSIEQQDVQTTQDIYTPITHHDNSYLPCELHGKHLINDPPNMERVHPINKTGTLSNNSFFVKKEHLEEKNLDNKIEFSERSSIINRIDEENFLKHFIHYEETSTNELFNIIDGTTLDILDDSTNTDTSHFKPNSIIKNENTITVYFEKND